MVHNELIRDNSISLQCRLILVSLLANKDDWIINITQLHHQYKDHMCKETLYKFIKEAITAGYLKRESFILKGLKKYRYFLSETPRFKKCLLYTVSPCTENPCTKQDEVLLAPSLEEKKEQTNKQTFVRSSEISEQKKAAPEGLGQQKEAIELLKDYNLTPSVRARYSKLPLDELIQAVKATEQYAKANTVDNIEAVLTKAIKEKWKPNSKIVKPEILKSWRKENLSLIAGMEYVRTKDVVVFKSGEMLDLNTDPKEVNKFVDAFFHRALKSMTKGKNEHSK